MINFEFKNKWKTPNKSGKKVAAKLRIGKVTVLDIYFTIGEPKVSVTLFNFNFVIDNIKDPLN